MDLYEQFRIHDDIFMTFGCHPGKVQEYNDVTKAQMLDYVENWGKKVFVAYCIKRKRSMTLSLTISGSCCGRVWLG